MMFHRPFLLVALLVCGGCYVGVDVPADSGDPDSAGPGGPGGDDAGTPTTSDGEPGEDDPDASDFKPAPASLRLLLSRQYTNAVRDLLGPEAAAAASPPADTALNGFEAIAAAQVALSDSAIDAYEKSARKVAAAAMQNPAHIASLLGCVPSGVNDTACHRTFVTRFGHQIWRRPLTTVEVDLYTDVASEAALTLGSFDAGVEAAIATFLQSPFFLYQVEVGEPDPDAPELRTLTSLERATRLSFFLLDTTPSADILALAEAGDLATADGVRSLAEAMVEQTAARAALGNFYAEVLKLRTLEALAKNPEVFPQFSPALATAMREETLALIDDVAFTADGDFRDILDAPYTFVNGPLAALYNLVADPGELEGWQRMDLPPASKRGGILGQAAFLSAYAHANTSSPTLRGKFVREILMCQGMPAPPGDVVTELPEGGDYNTMRERLSQHLTDPACAPCHTLMDPIGLGLENFDGIGVFRSEENGVVLETTEEIFGLGTFDGARELGGLLRQSPDVTRCVVRNLFRHATGHLEVLGEKTALLELDDAFATSEYRMKDLLVELVASPAFLHVGPQQ